MKTYYAVSGLFVTVAGAWYLNSLDDPGPVQPADIYFVVLLVIASLILCAGTVYVRNRFRGLARALEEHAVRGPHTPTPPTGLIADAIGLLRHGKEDPDRLLALVFDLRLSMLCGIVYGMAFASVPFWFAVHDVTAHQAQLSFFLFTVNFITGSVLYSLTLLLRQAWSWSERLHFQEIVSESRLLQRYVRLLQSITLIAAVDILFVIASVYFSKFTGLWVYIFSLYAGVILLLVYFVPLTPIRRRLNDYTTGQSEKIRLSQYDLLQHGLTELSVQQYDRLRLLEETIRNNAKTITRNKTVGVKSFAALTGAFPLVLDAGVAVLPALTDMPVVQNLINLTVAP